MENDGSNGGQPNTSLLQMARGYHYRDSLTNEEYEALKSLNTQLVNVSQSDGQFFILGSYENGKKGKLIDVKKAINQWPGTNCSAYLMEDFPGGLPSVVKFRLIADNSDYVIGICEDDKGGFQLELGMVIVLSEYFERTHLLKREYTGKKDEQKYSWMLRSGVFDQFQHHDRLWEWQTPQDFAQEAASLINRLS